MELYPKKSRGDDDSNRCGLIREEWHFQKCETKDVWSRKRRGKCVGGGGQVEDRIGANSGYHIDSRVDSDEPAAALL